MSMRRSLLLLVFALAVGCAPAAPSHITLRLAAASDLQTVLPKIIQEFENQDKGKLDVVPTFGSTGQLAEQIRSGAPFDLFMAADRSSIDELVKLNEIDRDSVADYARGALVLVAAKGLAIEVKTLEDLARPEVRSIAIANPKHAPYGAAAEQALRKSGLWKAVAPKIVQGESVRQALQFVETGNADVGLVSKSIVDPNQIRTLVKLDQSLCDPIIQAVGVVSRTKHLEAALRFHTFVLRGKGSQILLEHGFVKP